MKPRLVASATLALLALLPTHALADAAWVLWMRDSSNPLRWSWRSLSTHTTDDKCEAARREYAYMFLERWAVPGGHRGSRGANWPTYECWPDTVDPRGPKVR